MTDVNVAALRVLRTLSEDELAETLAVTFPRYLQVHIPAINEVRTYDLMEVIESAIVNVAEHGLSQRLGDSAAGKTGDKAEEAVTKREKTLWADGRIGVKTDPVTAEMHTIVCAILRKPKSEGGQGLKTKELPSLKEFPAFLAKQDQDAVAKIRAVAEANVEAKKAATTGLTL